METPKEKKMSVKNLQLFKEFLMYLIKIEENKIEPNLEKFLGEIENQGTISLYEFGLLFDDLFKNKRKNDPPEPLKTLYQVFDSFDMIYTAEVNCLKECKVYNDGEQVTIDGKLYTCRWSICNPEAYGLVYKNKLEELKDGEATTILGNLIIIKKNEKYYKNLLSPNKALWPKDLQNKLDAIKEKESTEKTKKARELIINKVKDMYSEHPNLLERLLKLIEKIPPEKCDKTYQEVLTEHAMQMYDTKDEVPEFNSKYEGAI
jgi:hypothetical protein